MSRQTERKTLTKGHLLRADQKHYFDRMLQVLYYLIADVGVFFRHAKALKVGKTENIS